LSGPWGSAEEIVIEISEAATDVLERAYDAAQRFNPAARIRVFRRKGKIETGFADAPLPSDQTVEHQGMILFVSAEVGEGTLDVTAEHDRLYLRE
jgi:hypothetical protein